MRMAEIPFTLVRPQEWQKGLSGYGTDQRQAQESIDESGQAVLSNAKGLTLKTADALLILRHHLVR